MCPVPSIADKCFHPSTCPHDPVLDLRPCSLARFHVAIAAAATLTAPGGCGLRKHLVQVRECQRTNLGYRYSPPSPAPAAYNTVLLYDTSPSSDSALHRFLNSVLQRNNFRKYKLQVMADGGLLQAPEMAKCTLILDSTTKKQDLL